MSLRQLVVAAVVASAGAAVCGAQTTPDTTPATPVTKDAKAKPARKNRDVITPDEFEAPELRTMNVLDVVKRLRPNFLNSRNVPGGMNGGDGTAGRVHASVDWHTVTDVEELASMTLDAVKEIRFLNPSQALQRFGSGAAGGPVILVRTM